MNECMIDWCRRSRVPGASYCSEHLTHAWRNRLPAEENDRREAEWVKRMKAGKLPAKELAA